MRSCRNCGATLEGSDGPVACARCGAREPEALAIEPRGDGSAPAAPSPAVKAMLAVGMAVAGLGFAALFFARVKPPEETSSTRRPGRAGAPGGSGAAAAVGAPLATFVDALCFADASGDDVLDPVLWLDGETRGRVVAVDGRTGQGLWSSQSIAKPDALACAGKDTVLAGGEEEAVLRALDARTGKERWAAKLAAAADEVIVGDGCVTVLMKDGAATGLKVQTGEPTECASAQRPEAYTGSFWERKKNPQRARVGDIDVTLTAQTSGAPNLTAEGVRGATPLWKKPLAARAPTSVGRPDVFLAASAGVAVALGVDAAGGGELRLIGVDAATGGVRYEKAAGFLGTHPAAMKASGPYVYIISGAALHAVDPATGEAAWRAAAPPKSP